MGSLSYRSSIKVFKEANGLINIVSILLLNITSAFCLTVAITGTIRRNQLLMMFLCLLTGLCCDPFLGLDGRYGIPDQKCSIVV